MDYPLNLHEGPRGATIYNAGIEVHDLSWWFWIKAGIGFTFGAWIVTAIGYTLYMLFLVNTAIGLFRLLSRH